VKVKIFSHCESPPASGDEAIPLFSGDCFGKKRLTLTEKIQI